MSIDNVVSIKTKLSLDKNDLFAHVALLAKASKIELSANEHDSQRLIFAKARYDPLASQAGLKQYVALGQRLNSILPSVYLQ